jgi:hypothetical protein
MVESNSTQDAFYRNSLALNKQKNKNKKEAQNLPVMRRNFLEGLEDPPEA